MASYSSPTCPSPDMSKSRSSSLETATSTLDSSNRRSDSVESAAKPPSSTTSESLTVLELDQASAQQLDAMRMQKPGGRAVDAGKSHRSRRRILDTSIVQRILSHYQPSTEVEHIPVAIKRITDREYRNQAAGFAATLRWRSAMLEMRAINPYFKEAVETHNGWTELFAMCADEHGMAAAFSTPSADFFHAANRLLLSFCASCLLNYGPTDEKTDLFPRQTGYGVLLLCEDHCTAPLVDNDDDGYCCTVCLGGAALGEDARLVANEDQQMWPWASTTCFLCRYSAVYHLMRRLCAIYPEPLVNRACGASRIQRDYLEDGYGSASDVWQDLTEELWLLVNTCYDSTRRNFLLRKQHSIRKMVEKRAAQAHARGEVFEVPSSLDNPINPVDMEDAEEERCRADAIEARCWEMLHEGYWMSPAEQWERFGGTRSVSCLVLGLQAPSEGEAAQMVPLPSLPPPSLKEQVERCYWGLLNMVARWALERLTKSLQLKEKDPAKHLEYSNKWTASDLIRQLQDPVCWDFWEAGPPKVPRSLLQMGHQTTERLGAIWWEVSAILRECHCGICSRTKRKREQEDEGHARGRDDSQHGDGKMTNMVVSN